MPKKICRMPNFMRPAVTGIQIFEQPDPELDSWFYFCVESE
jgi:hypothetical protein